MIVSSMTTLEIKMTSEEWACSEECLDMLLSDPDFKFSKFLDEILDEHSAIHLRKLLRAMSKGLSGSGG